MKEIVEGRTRKTLIGAGADGIEVDSDNDVNSASANKVVG